jgi:DNA polymerase I-like protein with 3'-5' exonuclease and polymerase domains
VINLSSHIAKLKDAEPRYVVSDNLMLFLGTAGDKPYLRMLKGCTGGYSCKLYLEPVTVLTQIEMFCDKHGITKVVSTSVPLLKKLLHWEKRAAPSLSDYAGSHFYLKKIEVIFLPPLKSLATVTYGKFLTTRIISKLTKPEGWYEPTDFVWSILDATNEAGAYESFTQPNCFLICVDIETFREDATIRCLSYTGFWYDSGEDTGIHSESVVLPLDSTYNLSLMRKWNCLPAPKVLQNGKYDISYLSRYNAPLHNYLYDTAHLFHSWYSELPKDLGFLNAFFIREATYWKDLAETNDLHEYYRYNALDTWGTGNCFLAMLLEAPTFALDNYILEFPLVFPCHMAEMQGIKRDMPRLEVARAEQQAIVDTKSASLNTILGIPAGEVFNVKSPKQMRQLLDVLGCRDIKKADEKSLKKARFRHPLNGRIIGLVLEIRKARTLISNYLTAGKEFYRQDDSDPTFLYALNPHGTDTSRLASRSHHFWCGDNIQKIPRGHIIKQTFKADPGFEWFEADYSQAESRDTAYISGDLKLIDSVENAPDFHKRNASLFFGIPEEEITKAIRQISKNVNHGSNYNMGWYVLIDTMGEENIVLARKLLGLPSHWTFRQVAEYLLATFHKAYPDISAVMYPGIINEVLTTHMLESGGWVRYCFGDPTKSKPILNAYIAHKPQCLNAQTLNKAFLSVFTHLSLDPAYNTNIKIKAQVHDSILGQNRIGYRHLAHKVAELMAIPVAVTSYTGVDYEFVVPVDINTGAEYWSDLKG